MSKAENSDDLDETLFSFELLVEYIRVETGGEVSDELALGVRLLDFPTLIIYQNQRKADEQHGGHEQRGEHAFNRGKSCFFLMNLNSLHQQLSNTPLYAMVLDVKEEIPKLVGSSLISLAKVMDRITQDVAERGVSAPSSHREGGLVGICNLMGENIGSISLSYKLVSLGSSLVPHNAQKRGLKSTSGGQPVHTSFKGKNISTESVPFAHSPTLHKSDIGRNIQNKGLSLISADIQDDAALCGSTEHRARAQISQTAQQSGNCFEEDLTIFCPPPLYFSNSAEEKRKSERGVYRQPTLDSDAFSFESLCSEDELTENKTDGAGSPTLDHRVRYDSQTSRIQKTSGVGPNGLGEALRQLPLLNALLVELSQLNGQNPHQPLSIHPNLAWIYSSASTEQGDTSRKTLAKTIEETSPHTKHLHPPRNCSTPIRATSVQNKGKQVNALFESKSSSKYKTTQLVYGTTKTFDLRLKQSSLLKVTKHRECTELIQKVKKTNVTKGNTKPRSKTLKSGQRKSILNQRLTLNENVETMIQSITVKQQETAAPHRLSHLDEKDHDEQDKDSLSVSENKSLSERRNSQLNQIPSVDSDSAAKNKNNRERSNRSDRSGSDSNRHRGRTESSGSSRHSSPKSSITDSSGEENKEADYPDDFEPSDAYSPDPVSSPGPSRAKTPSSPVRFNFTKPDSGSESVHKRAVLPVPLKAPGSPQRSLRATHTIRPRTRAPTLSFSSNDADREGSPSLHTIRSTRQVTETGRVERSSGAESFLSSRSQRSETTKNSGTVRSFSADSMSSFEEELEDELGSLDLGKDYKHISELVANKLPGYTM